MNSKEIIKKLSILYIEDDIEVKKDIIELLKVMFKIVYQADNGLDGFDIYNEKSPDIILTDIDMPKMNGIDFIKEVRKNDNNTQIIIISSYDDKKYLYEAVKLKLEDYILKPFSYKKFLNALENVIQKLSKDKNYNIKLLNNLIYEPRNGIIKSDDLKKYLTNQEKLMLDLLLEDRGLFINYEIIENRIWKDKEMSKDSLKTLINRLKNKLGKNSINAKLGFGYKLNI